jgi:hypothetical protein
VTSGKRSEAKSLVRRNGMINDEEKVERSNRNI